jgi:hypothetical protein
MASVIVNEKKLGKSWGHGAGWGPGYILGKFSWLTF